MSMFQNWKQYHNVPAKSPEGVVIRRTDGTPYTERVQVKPLTTEEAVALLMSKGRALANDAVRDGWHVQLIGFVQQQPRLPNSNECELIVLDHQKIERATEGTAKRQAILETRARLAEEISPAIQAAE